MKKIVALFAIVATTMLASCGNGNGTSTETVDSTEASVDTLAVDSVSIPVEPLKEDDEKVEEVK